MERHRIGAFFAVSPVHEIQFDRRGHEPQAINRMCAHRHLFYFQSLRDRPKARKAPGICCQCAGMSQRWCRAVHAKGRQVSSLKLFPNPSNRDSWSATNGLLLVVEC